MRAVVKPTCPYCGSRYFWYGDADQDPLKRCRLSNSVLVKCSTCKERYYVSAQQRYIGRKTL